MKPKSPDPSPSPSPGAKMQLQEVKVQIQDVNIANTTKRERIELYPILKCLVDEDKYICKDEIRFLKGFGLG